MLDTILAIMLMVCVGLLIINLIMDIVAHRLQIKRIKKEYEVFIKRIEDERNGSDSKV